MKPKRVVIIDPVTATVRTEVWDGKLEQVYKWLRCSTVEHVNLRKPGYVLWCDEDARLKTNIPKWYYPDFFPYVIVGPGMIFRLQGDVHQGLVDELNKEMNWGLLMGPGAVTTPGQH